MSKRNWATAFKLAAGAYNTYQKYKSANSAVAAMAGTGSRTRVRRKKRVGSSHRPQGASTFVRCKDVRLRDAVQRISRFERKVLMATSNQYALKKTVNENGWWAHAGPYSMPDTVTLSDQDSSKYFQTVGWFQLALNAMRSNSLTRTDVCSSMHVDQMHSTVNPCGLVGNVVRGASVSTGSLIGKSAASAMRTIYEEIYDLQASAGANGMDNLLLTDRTFNLGKRYYKLVFRNPQKYGVRVHLYYVRPRRAQLYVNEGDVGGLVMDLNGTFSMPGTNALSNWNSITDFHYSPLEAFAYGLSKQGYSPKDCCRVNALNLNDSVDFVNRFRTVSVCTVYIPPGGTCTKTYSHKSRFINSNYLRQHCWDSKTGFIVGKVVPEPQVLPDVSAKAAGGFNDDNQAYRAVIGVHNINQSLISTPALCTVDQLGGVALDYPRMHVYGTISVRSSIRLLPERYRQPTIVFGSTIGCGNDTVAREGDGVTVREVEDVGGANAAV